MSASAVVRRVPVSGTAAVIALLTILYVLVRMININTSVTVDEPVFLGISANFATALAKTDFASTAQFLYPAVPVMWCGVVGFIIAAPRFLLDYGQYIPSDFQANAEPIRSVGSDPLSVLHAARASMVLFEGILFAIALWLVARIFGRWIAVIAAAFIVFDPFLVSHDQILHVDGLTGISAFASMLAIAYADRFPNSRRYWAIAGALGAICWLTRLTGMVLIPIALLVMADHAVGTWRSESRLTSTSLSRFGQSAGAFLGAGMVTSIVIWPALWAAPYSTIEFLVTSWKAAMETPHEWGLYFMGKTVTGDPGALFYPVVIAFKLTPFTMMGLALFTLAVTFRIESWIPRAYWRPLVVLCSFVIIYTVGMTLGSRKFDRYILPDFLVFDLFTAIVMVGILRTAWSQRTAIWRYACAGIATLFILGQMSSISLAQPYPLLYYNPLLGGLTSAEHALMPGWGEGVDNAAAWILSQSNPAPKMVRSTISPPLLTYYFPPGMGTGGLGLSASPTGIWQWANTDYGITTILQWHRGAYQGVTDAFAGRQPVHVETVDGRDIVRVYDLATIPPPEALFTGNPCVWNFDNGIAFVGYGTHITEMQEHSSIELVFQTRDATRLHGGFVVQGMLHSRDGSRADIPFTTILTANPTQGLLAIATASVALPPNATPDQYWPEIQLLGTGETTALPLVPPESGQDGTRAGSATC